AILPHLNRHHRDRCRTTLRGGPPRPSSGATSLHISRRSTEIGRALLAHLNRDHRNRSVANSGAKVPRPFSVRPTLPEARRSPGIGVAPPPAQALAARHRSPTASTMRRRGPFQGRPATPQEVPTTLPELLLADRRVRSNDGPRVYGLSQFAGAFETVMAMAKL